ncbi:uncharacterized protein A1O9_12285 [Exophiala aquamarina CBS 119918]|uniref:G-patch domain-containing protein n=1 Tax=Exophiala aquamarina CBS 119918 TaxID=1182545 RepID=A0A072P7R1_9EURO|nr:uncharacterized protein A1O9_12285 [Exophiala aquamarina CBS 119918]KEF51650.1 hypothetical protein A1O9_12285 [Exophiala aquamarina CBS 119918]
MDAHAHLLSLGWAGPGHALDSKPYKQKGHRGLAYDPSQASNTGNGLVKPLLVSQRQGRLGIGKKAHEPQAGNEWWLKGFESALGNIGKSESERSSGASTPVPNYTGRKHSGLYSFFVKGQEMAGTIDENGVITNTKKRKAELSDKVDDSNSEQSTTKTPSESKRLKKSPLAVEFEQVSEYIALRDKGEKRRGRTERPSPVEEFRQVGEYIQALSQRESKKRKRRSDEEPDGADTASADIKFPEVVETKDDRRERRRQRREEKDRLRSEEASAAEGRNGRPKRTEHEEDDPAAKAARKAERKKRKAEKAAKLLVD